MKALLIRQEDLSENAADLLKRLKLPRDEYLTLKNMETYDIIAVQFPRETPDPVYRNKVYVIYRKNYHALQGKVANHNALTLAQWIKGVNLNSSP